MANTLNIEEKLTAKKRPLGCIETDRGSSLNLWESNPFFSYPSASKKFQILTVLSSEQEASNCFVTERDKLLIFLLWKPEAKN